MLWTRFKPKAVVLLSTVIRERSKWCLRHRFISRRVVVREWSTVLSHPLTINLSLSPSLPSSSFCATWLRSLCVTAIIYSSIIYGGHLWVCLWPHFVKNVGDPIRQDAIPIMIGKNCNRTGLVILCTMDGKQIHFMSFLLHVMNILFCLIPTYTCQINFYLTFLYLLTFSGASDWKPAGTKGPGGQGSAGGAGAAEKGEPRVKRQAVSHATPETASEPAR